MTLFVESRGTGSSTVVLLNGTPSDVDWGTELAQALQTSARVLTPHLPGYGRSPGRSPYVWDDVRFELIEALRDAGMQRPVFVGFSGGAWRALEFASDPSLGTRGVVCLSGIATLDAIEREGFRQFSNALRAGADLRPLAAPRFLARRLDDPSAIARVQGWLDAIAPRALADELDALASQPDCLTLVGDIPCPILVRNGTADQVCAPPKALAIVNAARQGRLEMVEGAGHALMLEDTDDTIASVTRFVATLER